MFKCMQCSEANCMNITRSVVATLITHDFLYAVVRYGCYDQRYKSSRKKNYVILICIMSGCT